MNWGCLHTDIWNMYSPQYGCWWFEDPFSIWVPMLEGFTSPPSLIRSTRISAVSCCRTDIALMKSLMMRILTSFLPNLFLPRLVPAALVRLHPAPFSKRKSKRDALHRSRNQHFLLWGHMASWWEVAESITRSWGEGRALSWLEAQDIPLHYRHLLEAPRLISDLVFWCNIELLRCKYLGRECGQLVPLFWWTEASQWMGKESSIWESSSFKDKFVCFEGKSWTRRAAN